MSKFTPFNIALASALAAVLCFLPVLVFQTAPMEAVETKALLFNGAIADGGFQKTILLGKETVVKEVRLAMDEEQAAPEGEAGSPYLVTASAPRENTGILFILDTTAVPAGLSGVRSAPVNPPLLFNEDRLILMGAGLSANTYSLQVVLTSAE